VVLGLGHVMDSMECQWSIMISLSIEQGLRLLQMRYSSWPKSTQEPSQRLQCLVKIEEGQPNLSGYCQSIFSLCRHHPSKESVFEPLDFFLAIASEATLES